MLQKRTVNDQWLKKVVKYDENGIKFYRSFVKSVVMLQNGTTSFMLLNLTKEDAGLYCCEINIKTSGGGKTGKSYRECTQLTILGKAIPRMISVLRRFPKMNSFDFK